MRIVQFGLVLVCVLGSKLNVKGFDDVEWSSCASSSGCGNCTAMAGCHFCESDQKCHSYGSIYGCSVGLTCLTSVNQCMRSGAEFDGYDFVPIAYAWAVCGVFTACLFLICCCTCSVYVLLEHCRRRRFLNDLQKINVNNERELFGLQGDSEGAVYVQLAEAPVASSNGNVVQTDLERRAQVIEQHRHLNYVAKKPGLPCVGKCCKHLTIISILVIVLATVMAYLYFPQKPKYSMCSNTVEWTSVLEGLKHLQLRADMMVLFSIKNPNRFNVLVHSATAVFKYHGSQVGKGEVKDVYLSAGAITDVLFKIDFSPGITTAASMYEAHTQGILLLDIELDFKTDVFMWGRNLLAYNTSFVETDVDPDNEDGSTKYCKCKLT